MLNFTHIGLDFESRSVLSLPDVGAHKYAYHPSSEPICLRWRLYDPLNRVRGNLGLWYPGLDLPDELLDAVENGLTGIAHNAGFDRVYWDAHMSPLLAEIGCINLNFPEWECTAIRAAANGLPRGLEDCCAALGYPVGKDAEGRKALEKMWKPQRGKWIDTPELRDLVYRYCGEDIDRMLDVYEDTYPPSEYDRRVYRLNDKINATGLPVDLTSCQRIVDRLGDNHTPGTAYHELQTRLVEKTEGLIGSTTKTKEFKERCLAFGVEMKDFKQQTVEDTLANWSPDWPETIRAALEIRALAGLTSAKKFPALLSRAEELPFLPGWGVLRDAYVMDGAHTGRWTSRGFQTQNLKAETASQYEFEALLSWSFDEIRIMFDEPIRLAGNAVRPIIRAFPGRKLMLGDFSKIETCVLFWLVGDEAGVARLRDGVDVYKLMAATIFNVAVADVTKEQRQLGKRAVLGLGFGCGAARFQAMCWEYDSVRITMELAQRAVDAYRALYRKVVQFWYNLEATIRRAIINPGMSLDIGPLSIVSNGDVLTIVLPSGRPLYYQKPRVSGGDEISYYGVDSKTTRYCEQRTWGGKLTENVVQAIANDLLREAMLRVDAAGYPIIMHSHDEIVTHVPVEMVDIAAFKAVMELKGANDNEKAPWWAGIPIVVEAAVMERYSK